MDPVVSTDEAVCKTGLVVACEQAKFAINHPLSASVLRRSLGVVKARIPRRRMSHFHLLPFAYPFFSFLPFCSFSYPFSYPCRSLSYSFLLSR